MNAYIPYLRLSVSYKMDFCREKCDAMDAMDVMDVMDAMDAMDVMDVMDVMDHFAE